MPHVFLTSTLAIHLLHPLCVFISLVTARHQVLLLSLFCPIPSLGSGRLPFCRFTVTFYHMALSKFYIFGIQYHFFSIRISSMHYLFYVLWGMCRIQGNSPNYPFTVSHFVDRAFSPVLCYAVYFCLCLDYFRPVA